MNNKFFKLSLEKQQRIINAAYKVFSQNSYKKAPMSEIADEGGISKALLFHYFVNKKELYLYLWNYSIEITRKAVADYEVLGTEFRHRAELFIIGGSIALDTTPLGLQYYSKSDLWWLKQITPMAKCFPEVILRMSIAWSVSNTKYSYQKMMSMLKPFSKIEIIEQMQIAYENFSYENKNVAFSFPVLILIGDKDSTGKEKAYCIEWAKQTGYPLHFIKEAKHFANGDNPKQVNAEISLFIKNLTVM